MLTREAYTSKVSRQLADNGEENASREKQNILEWLHLRVPNVHPTQSTKKFQILDKAKD